MAVNRYKIFYSPRLCGSLGFVGALMLSACGGQAVKPGQAELPNTVADLQVVDCLLPGQLRRLGNTSYMTPRRPTRTTAADCRTRGGEYVAYDRANYKTALAVWLPDAEKGDADAQTNVGEIFERGLGGEPNYEAAVIWYQKAADQGNSRAQFNLGTLYEQGNGVEKDKLQALNWYRKAWDLPEDSVMYQSAAKKQQQALRDSLEKSIANKNYQIKLLRRQIGELQSKITNTQTSHQLKDELQQLKDWIKSLEQEQLIAQAEYDRLPRLRQPFKAAGSQRLESGGEAKAVQVKDMEFGRYYALIIGMQDYQEIDDLRTPFTDAKRAQTILEQQYGFNVTVLLDADNTTVMKAVNDLNKVLTDKDNLLIFYAGHGSRISTGETEAGYWLPVNASPPPDDTYWVSNEFVTRHLSRLQARRIMVVADSCYAGLLSTAPGYLFMGDKAQASDDYIRYKLPKKSRLLLSSGGDRPVLDNAGGGHSVFARAFLDALEESQSIMSGPELFLKVRNKVIDNARDIGFEQQPEFKAIKGAGHEVGDFFFVKKIKS